MSAFLVSDRHLSALVNAARVGAHGGLRLDQFVTGVDTRDRAAQERALFTILRDENIASITHRYPSDSTEDIGGTYDTRVQVSPFNPSGIPLMAALKAISCYEYQACEHNGWEASVAARYCAVLRKHLVRQLPGFDDADGWSL